MARSLYLQTPLNNNLNYSKLLHRFISITHKLTIRIVVLSKKFKKSLKTEKKNSAYKYRILPFQQLFYFSNN